MFGFPNWTRTASASVVTGFHSAIVRSTPGIVSVGTKVLATNVIGNQGHEGDAGDPLGGGNQAAEQHANQDHGERESDEQRGVGHPIECGGNCSAN